MIPLHNDYVIGEDPIHDAAINAQTEDYVRRATWELAQRLPDYDLRYVAREGVDNPEKITMFDDDGNPFEVTAMRRLYSFSLKEKVSD